MGKNKKMNTAAKLFTILFLMLNFTQSLRKPITLKEIKLNTQYELHTTKESALCISFNGDNTNLEQADCTQKKNSNTAWTIEKVKYGKDKTRTGFAAHSGATGKKDQVAGILEKEKGMNAKIEA